MNAKILVFVICIKADTYLLLYNLHEYTFKDYSQANYKKPMILFYIDEE